jgi:hypothetical protein
MVISCDTISVDIRHKAVLCAARAVGNYTKMEEKEMRDLLCPSLPSCAFCIPITVLVIQPLV